MFFLGCQAPFPENNFKPLFTKTINSNRGAQIMLKAKILREVQQAPVSDVQAAQKLQQAQKPAPAAAQPAAPVQPDQKQVQAQAIEAIKQIVMPIITQTLNEYFTKTFPGVLQNALKAQKQPAAQAAPVAPAAQKPAATQPAPAAPVK